MHEKLSDSGKVVFSGTLPTQLPLNLTEGGAGLRQVLGV